MPIRVRCRCGNELVLRYGEWVYVFVGLTLVALVVNTLVLVLLFFRLEEPRLPATPPPSTSPPETTERSTSAGSPDGDSPPAGFRSLPPDGAPTAPLRDNRSGSGDGSPTNAPGDRRSSSIPNSVDPATEEAASSPDGALDPERALASDRAGKRPLSLRAGGDVEESLRALLAPPEPPSSVPPVVAADAAGFEEAPVLPWSRDAALWRLFLLGRAGIGRIPPEAFLWDPDPGLQRLAVEAALDPSRATLVGEEGRSRRRLLTFAAPTLRGRNDARPLIAGMSGVASGERESALSTSELLTFLEARGTESGGDRAAAALRRFASDVDSRGQDVVLLIDASRSMDGVLPVLRRDLSPFLASMARLLPSWRLGVLLYRDDVEACVGFEQGSVDASTRAIQGARAEGGGDVPEGVHVALRSALALGNYAWAKSSRKHIVIVADAPAPFGEQEPLLLLAQQAYDQGDYRIHVLSFESGSELGSRTPWLSALARRGGGRWFGLERPEEVPAGLLRCLLPAEAHEVVDELLRAVRRFGG